MNLTSGTLLERGKYRIISTLGRGGFGITYLAEQVLMHRKVCIKEFFPKDFFKRDEGSDSISILSQGQASTMSRFKEKFLKEAQTIAALDHPNIIHILDVFEENNTAYYVMEYVDGGTLSDLVKRCGALAEVDAVRYIKEVASALGYIHEQKINHLDVKPGNIMVRAKDDKTILIDFGLSKHYDEVGEQTSSTPVGISHGYAPLEQYNVGGVNSFSPATDIYSLGATLYYLVTGQQPPVASVVGEDGIGNLPVHLRGGVVQTIEKSMSYWRKSRPQSISEFMTLLGSSDNTEQKPVEEVEDKSDKSQKSDNKSVVEKFEESDKTIIENKHTSESQNTVTYKVGDYYNENGKEGVVFEVWDGGCHGKIVSMDTIQTQWDTRVKFRLFNLFNRNGVCTNADSETDGKANTDKIMARSDIDYFPAFTWCRAKGDSWYLPAKSELMEIYHNRHAINETMSKHDGVRLLGYHWSSTESDADSKHCAWPVYMYYGTPYIHSKNFSYCVRAVSAF